MRLVIDWDSGEGDVVFSERFMRQDPLFRADVLQDWINILQESHSKATTELYSEIDNAQLIEYKV
jgi:hypothetical protein